jgi:arsenate reductase (glutaredoxin)
MFRHNHDVGKAMSVTIYHNPKCTTSRNVLGLLRDAGQHPHIIEYLKKPPSRAELKRLVKRMGVKVSDIVRWKEPIAGALGLDKDSSSDDVLLDAMVAHPILINRPIVVTDDSVKLCRPSETVKELL